MYDYLAQTFGIIGGTLGRIAFIVFIVALLGTRRLYRAILWTLAGIQLVTNLVLVIILFVQCPGHASAIWAPSGEDNCWDVRVQAYYGYYQGCKSDQTQRKPQMDILTRYDTQLSIQQQICIWRLSRHAYSGISI